MGEEESHNWAVVMQRDMTAHVPEKIYRLSSSLSVLAAIQRWRSEGRVAAWLHVPILQSHLIAPAASLGFHFHHAESDSSTLTLWLGEGPSRLPGYATHQVGVAGQFQSLAYQKYLFIGLPCLLAAELRVCLWMLVQWALCDCDIVLLKQQRLSVLWITGWHTERGEERASQRPQLACSIQMTECHFSGVAVNWDKEIKHMSPQINKDILQKVTFFVIQVYCNRTYVS